MDSRVKIVQYDLAGNPLKIFNGFVEANKFLGLNNPNSVILNSIKKDGTAYGFRWRRWTKDFSFENILPIMKLRHKRVVQISLDGIKICTFKNGSIAGLAVGGTYDCGSNIRSCINGKTKTAYGFKWKYAS